VRKSKRFRGQNHSPPISSSVYSNRKKKKKEDCQNDGTALESSRKINTQLK
jgi:hypothetical protein